MAKAKWIANAAREVEEALGLIGLDELIATAIEKHCPDDKVGKLMEAAKRVTFVAQVGRTPTIKDVEAWQIAMVRLEAAIAEYEKVGYVKASEDKTGKLVEALKEIALTDKTMIINIRRELTVDKLINRAQIAIAEYEKVGYVKASEDKTGKLMEDLLLVVNRLEMRRDDGKWNDDPTLLDDDVLESAYATIAEHEKITK